MRFVASFQRSAWLDASIYRCSATIDGFGSTREQRGDRASAPCPSCAPLTDLDDVSETSYQAARASLLERGALGLRPSATELADIAEGVDWQPTQALFRLLTDQAWWQADPIEAWGGLTGFVVQVYQRAPEELAIWTARVLDSAARASPGEDMRTHALLLIASAWDWTPADSGTSEDFLRALVDVLRKPPPSVGLHDLREVPLIALARYAAMLRGLPRPQRTVLLLRALSWLPLGDQISAIDLLASVGAFAPSTDVRAEG